MAPCSAGNRRITASSSVGGLRRSVRIKPRRKSRVAVDGANIRQQGCNPRSPILDPRRETTDRTRLASRTSLPPGCQLPSLPGRGEEAAASNGSPDVASARSSSVRQSVAMVPKENEGFVNEQRDDRALKQKAALPSGPNLVRQRRTWARKRTFSVGIVPDPRTVHELPQGPLTGHRRTSLYSSLSTHVYQPTLLIRQSR